jgi:uncharacterized protein YdeI (YjbR/CyaY-like superfamily)
MDITDTTKPRDRNQWREWLDNNHKTLTEIWLLSDNRPKEPTVTYLDAVEEAICFGWIDGIQKRYSTHELAQRFTPRKKRSNWTELNKERARRLIRLAEDIMEVLRTKPAAWSNFLELPSLYHRVRIGYVEEMRKNPTEFDRRLQNFVNKTADNKMFGNWNDGGRLL